MRRSLIFAHDTMAVIGTANTMATMSRSIMATPGTLRHHTARVVTPSLASEVRRLAASTAWSDPFGAEA